MTTVQWTAARRYGGLAVVVATVLTAVPTYPLTAQAPDFSWKGRVPTGKVIEIRGVNGDVSATLTSGNEVQVTAVKRSRRSDPEEVQIEVIEHGEGVTICAVYPTPRKARHENTCAPGDGYRSSTEDNDVNVDFTVRVPARVLLDARTVNGDVSAEGLEGDVYATTVNGGVTISTTETAEATTVNGSIRATMGRADFRHAEFTTVNGGITLELPANLAAEVRAETINGDIDTDFPLSVSGRFSSRRLVGTIGSGSTSGRTLYLKTVNGSLKLRKR